MNKLTSTMLQIFSVFSLSILAISPINASAATTTIVDIASANASTSTLVAAVTAAGLVPTLSSTGPFTVFAPTNDAFTALDLALNKPAGSTVSLLVKPDNKTLLADILKYHVVSGSVNAATAATLSTANSVEGSAIAISTSNGSIFLNASTQNARVTTADVIASNGIIHLINKVILTPALTARVVAAYSAPVGTNFLPSSSAKFGTDITSCRATFDWVTYIADQRAGRTQSNPYIDQGCVTQFSATVDENANNILDTGDIKASNYANFAVGAASVKTAFGTDPVLGIFPTTVGAKTYPSQMVNTFTTAGAVAGSKTATNRAVKAGLTNTLTSGQLSELFSTSGGSASSSNIPRIFSTGPDTYNYFQNKSNSTQQIVSLSACLTNGSYSFTLCSRVAQPLANCTTNSTFDSSKCSREYQGGWCSISGGNIVVRETRAGVAFNPSNYGKDVANPSTACARPGKTAVEEQNLSVYQFVYEFKYPTNAQCADYFGVDAATCRTFYQKAYGQDLAGDTDVNTGSRILSVYTFYGSIDDLYSKFVGWVNPDVNGPRATSTDGFIRTYDGFSVYEL